MARLTVLTLCKTYLFPLADKSSRARLAGPRRKAAGMLYVVFLTLEYTQPSVGMLQADVWDVWERCFC